MTRCPPCPADGGLAAPPALPGCIARALDRVSAVRAREASAATHALRAALAPMTTSPWQEVAWRSSTLTATGTPVEFAWASRDTALRWTCEVAGPEVPEAARLRMCAAAAERLAGSAPELTPWLELQSGQRLRWGAWLGMRHRAPSLSAKVYVELPAHREVPRPWTQAAECVARLIPTSTPRMAGCNDDGSVELYARAASMTVPSLMGIGGFVGAGPTLVELVERLLNARPDGGPARSWPAASLELPRPSGVSVAVSGDGSPAAVTWFAFARAMWSSDARATATLAQLCGPEASTVDAEAGSAALYHALASGPDDGRWRHGMVGAGVDTTGATWLQAGIRPT